MELDLRVGRVTVVFNRDIIGELRNRAIAHNEAVSVPEDRVKIGQLKVLYKRFHAGTDPHFHALTKIDEQLQQIRLRKARRPFEGGRHPRDSRGEFSRSGATPPARGDDDLLSAAQTQVIPETRYSVLGPPVAAAGGVALGAIGGASATYQGSASDRLITRGLAAGGAKLGGKLTHALSSVPNIAAETSRAGIGAINRSLGTRIPRHGPVAVGPAGRAAAAAVGAKTGRFVGHTLGRGLGFAYSAPAAFARNTTSRVMGGGIKAQIGGRLAGALVGGFFPGAVIYARSLKHAQERIGPYEDTLLPRRVQKMAGPLFDAPEVLAKQAEILSDETLTKLNVGALAGRFLRAVSRRRPVATAAEAIRTVTPEQQQAETLFQRHQSQFRVRTKRQMAGALAVRHVLPHAITGAAIGAGLGAAGGAAYGAFDQKHPRDEHGRFSRKGQMTVAGAKLGAAIGLGLGLAGGLVAARTGHTGLLTAALARLRGEQMGTLHFPEGPESTLHDMSLDGTQGKLPDVMAARAQRGAKIAHAIAFQGRHPGMVREFGTGHGGEVEHVIRDIKRHHGVRFAESTLGQALASRNPATWYRYQLDRAFDATLKGNNSSRNLWKLGPVLGHDGEPLSRATENLIGAIDPEKLNPAQRTIWNDVAAKHESALEHITEVYAERGRRANQLGEHIATAESQRDILRDDLTQIPVQWQRLARNVNTDLEAIRTFAKNEMGVTLPRNIRTKDAAVAHINQDALPTWTTRTQAELDHIAPTLDDDAGLPQELKHANAARNSGLERAELEPIKNPFGLTNEQYFLRPRPAEPYEVLRDAHVEKQLKPFLTANSEAGQQAEDHLHSLLAAQEEALAARVPGVSAGQRFMAFAAPRVAPHINQAVEDFNALRGSSTTKLDKLQVGMRDFIKGNIAGMRAWTEKNGLSTGTYGARARSAGRIAKQNWKAIASLVGAGSAFGIIDANSPWIVQFDHKKWHRPRDIRVVHEFPDVVRRPNEALFGLSYLDRSNQRKFLHGVYVKNAAGDNQSIPFGADVEQVRGAVRTGHGIGGDRHNQAAPVENIKEVTDALSKLRTAGHIANDGPAGFQFEIRKGGDADKAEQDLVKSIRKTSNVDYLSTRKDLADSSTDKPNAFYEQGLFQVFGHPLAPVMGLAARAQLLIGNHLPMADANYQRGMFGGTSRKWPTIANATSDEITSALSAQMRSRNLEPNTPAKYTAMRQALWTVAAYYKLGARDEAKVFDQLDQHYRRATKQEPPTSAASAAAALDDEPSRDAVEVATHLVALTPHDQRPNNLASDEVLHDTLVAYYDGRHRAYLKRHPGEPRAAAAHAEEQTRLWLENQSARKVEPIGSLAKISGSSALAPGPRRPRRVTQTAQATAATDVPGQEGPPGSRSAPVLPPISRAASRQVTPVQQPGSPAGPSISHQIRQSLRPGRAANQLGSYGGSQLGSDLLGGLAHGLPGGALVHGAATIAGGLGGMAVGSRFGRPSSEKGDLGEIASRGIAGAGAQVGVSHVLSRLGIKSVNDIAAHVGRMAAGKLSTVARIGTGALGGAEEGAVAGAAVTPEAFGVGAIPGAIGGLLAGAVGGYLTDEGVGILYRHLRRYGAHVPAHILGIRPNQRNAARASA